MVSNKIIEVIKQSGRAIKLVLKKSKMDFSLKIF